MTTPFDSTTYDYNSNLLSVIEGASGLYYSILRHHPSTEYKLNEYLNYLTHSFFTNFNNGNVAFNILPGDNNGGPAGSVVSGLSSHATATTASGVYSIATQPRGTPTTGHTPRPLTEVLNTDLDGSNFLFKYLIYVVLNSTEVQSDYEADSNKPTWIFFRTEPYGNFGYIYISPDQQTIVIEPGWMSSPLWSDLSAPNSFAQNELDLEDPNGSNIFYLVVGRPERSSADATLAASFTLPTTGGAPYVSLPDGDWSNIPTATGAACSIIPKNFNLF